MQEYKERNNSDIDLVNGESTSADSEAAKKYPIEFEKLAHEGNYSESQLFNYDETGLYI